MRVSEMLGQPVKSLGFLERGQILALEVFDQGQFERFGVVGNLLDAGNLAKARRARGMIAALAGFLPARRASRIDPMHALREE